MGISNYKKMVDRQIMKDLSEMIKVNPKITTSELSIKVGLSTMIVQSKLKANGYRLMWVKDV